MEHNIGTAGRIRTVLLLGMAMAVAPGCDKKTEDASKTGGPPVQDGGSGAPDSDGSGSEGDKGLKLTSAAFKHQGEIPAKYTCEGDGISPPLSFSGVPEKAESLALIVDDPDAPDPEAPMLTWVHWVLFNIPPSAGGLAEGVKPADLPEGTSEGLSSSNTTGYGGPCPPIGRHRYFHKLYALDALLQLEQPAKDELVKAMEGHVIEKTELIGTYQKSE